MAEASSLPSCVSCRRNETLYRVPTHLDLAADDAVGADPPSGIDLALPFALVELPPRRLQEHELSCCLK